MEALQELTTIITRKKLLAAVGEGYLSELPPAPARLYHLIVAGEARNDAEARAQLFPQDTSTVRYIRAKNTLKAYLQQMLLVADLALPQHNARQKAYFDCQKSAAAVKLLMGRNARHSMLDLAASTLRAARQFEFSEIALELSRALRLYYGSVAGDLKKYDEYSALTLHYEGLVQAENLAEARYTDLVARFVNTKSAQPDVHREAREAFLHLQPLLAQYDSYRLHLSARLIEVLVHTSLNDYAGTVAICDRAIAFFEAKPYQANVPLQAFLLQKLVCLVQFRDYPQGYAVAERGMALLEAGSFNWFKYLELLVVLSLHAKQYAAACRHFREAVTHGRFEGLPASSRQVWKILEAYLYYLQEQNLLGADPESEAAINRFRMARFVNETPLYAKDKRGLNVPILIFQILYRLLKRRYDDTVDRMEAIEKYTSRYLRKGDDFRSNCFIKMLLQIPAAGFHRVAAARRAEPFVRQLQTVPLDFAGQAHDIEIIPYEELWGMALASLDLTPPRK